MTMLFDEEAGKMPTVREIRANKRKTVSITYMGSHRMKGRILSVDSRCVTFKIDQDGCRVMLLDRDKVRVSLES